MHPHLLQLRRFLALAILLAMVAPVQASPIVFLEDLGNFPDAIAVGLEFDTFGSKVVNGVNISGKTGLLFALENTSFRGLPDPAAAFRVDPDGDFAVSDVLTNAAATAIGNAQPFGIFSFGTNMHPDVAQDLRDGNLMSVLPSGFELNVEGLGGADPEVNFDIDAAFPDGLLFDDDAISIPSAFTNPRSGVLEFFIETNLPLDTILDATSDSINERGFDVRAEMAWANSSNQIVTEFSAPGETFDTQELRPRGEMGVQPAVIPEPSSLVLWGIGSIALAGCGRRRKRQAASHQTT